MSTQTQVDIVVYTNPAKLKHKQEDCYSAQSSECFWTFGRFPTRLREPHLTKLKDEWSKRSASQPTLAPLTLHDFAGRLYFAVKGFVVGSFQIEFVEEDDNEIFFHSETWKPLENPIPCKPFRGFRYRWW